MISFNLPDPTEQEKIRRGPHTYQAEGGVHGRYVPVANGRPVDKKESASYLHQEYPKVMDRTPFPQLKDFLGKPDAEILLEHERKRWDERQTQSIVANKAEEEKWVAEHGDDTILTPGAYPKTMDRTPPPKISDFAELPAAQRLEAYRIKREAWRNQITNSIVHDEVEEQLWLEEHAVPSAKAILAEHAALAKKKSSRKPRKAKAVAA